MDGIGMYYIGIAEWEKAEERLQKAMEMAKTIGNLKAYEESAVFLGTCYFHSGNLHKSVQVTQLAMEAFGRGDAQIQILATNAQARNYYALGDFPKCLSCLREVKTAFDSVGTNDISAQINFYSLNALMAFRKREFHQCWIFTECVFNILNKVEPTTFFTFTGFVILPEIYVRILHEPKYYQGKEVEVGFSKKELQNRLEKSLIFLGKYAEVFTFAEPRFHMWTGAVKFINGRTQKAEVDWSKALESAKKLKMSYEVAFILFMKGVITSNRDEIVNACKMFPEVKSQGIDLTTIKLKLIKMDTSSF